MKTAKDTQFEALSGFGLQDLIHPKAAAKARHRVIASVTGEKNEFPAE